jgi:fructosamine-3-kinase
MGKVLPKRYIYSGRMKPNTENHITHLLTEHLSEQIPTAVFTGISGGSINETFKVKAGSHTFFCKINSGTTYPGLFEKEASGLHAISETTCISTPGIIGTYYWNDQQVLLMEWVNSGTRTTAFWKKFGEQLAKMHLWKHGTDPTKQQAFGFKQDNYMGALPQRNTQMDEWCTFFTERRLKPQLELAGHHNLPAWLLGAFDKMYEKLPQIFAHEPASFLHGDLWSGNFLCNEQSEPVLIDPAVYYGHRSMDLAMTTLFGGFEKPFYEAYAYWYPLPSNYSEQWEVCNLYPLLIHLNLFGKSYLSSIESCLRRFQ